MAGLADGTTKLVNALDSGDTRSTIEGLSSLGVEVRRGEDAVQVQGTGGKLKVKRDTVDLGNSGTSLRLLTTVCSLAPGRIILTGDNSLRSRPMGSLLECLGQIGVEARSLKGNRCAPIQIDGRGRTRGGRAAIAGNVSSQFISSLLIPSPYFDDGLSLEVTGEIKSRPYIDLTIRTMEEFGASVEEKERVYEVRPRGGYSGREYGIDGDYSAAAFLIAASAITGSEIRVSGLKRDSMQADEGFLPILEEMGCEIKREGDSVKAHGGRLRGAEVDLSDSPDLLPPLSVVMSVAAGPSRIMGVEHARYKESDRISAMHTELAGIGIHSTERPDGLEFRGGEIPSGQEAFSHGDHRIAMALAVLGLISRGLVVRGASCIPISYPGFVTDLRALGAKVGWQ